MIDLITKIILSMHKFIFRHKRFKSCWHCKKQILWWESMRILVYDYSPIHTKCFVKAKEEDLLPKPLITIIRGY